MLQKHEDLDNPFQCIVISRDTVRERQHVWGQWITQDTILKMREIEHLDYSKSVLSHQAPQVPVGAKRRVIPYTTVLMKLNGWKVQ
jgi:hypothetical protein